MTAQGRFAFGAFRFDGRSGQLWRDDAEVKLTPRAAAVLHMLAERAPAVVTKQELFDRVWGGMAVGDDALTSCIQELRGAMGDDARSPRTIETRHRRGYRLMVPASIVVEQSGPCASPAAAQDPTRLVGRSAELGALARVFDEVRAGQRRLVFVSGEPGIGKSALLDAFLDRLRRADAAKIAHGQCVDHHGVGEPYLPLIEVLTRLAGAPDAAPVKEILAAQAPSWLAQMPSLWTRAERSAMEARGRATRERMLRELTHAIEAIAAEVPLALKLEDVHWSDASTLDWIAHMARRPEPARLMVLATFRPADAGSAKIGLDRIVTELALHGRCEEIALKPLGVEAIETYLDARLGDRYGAVRPREMAPLLLERTGGNPLFMTSIVRELATRPAAAPTFGAIASIPHDVRRYIDRQIDELDPADRDLLTAASVIRREFATAAVAAALDTDIERVEAACVRLARHGVFIVKSGATSAPPVWPDGTPAELYAFRHDLFRELLYDRLPATRRRLAHARVGRRLVSAWAGRLDAIAAELAEHFDRANDPVRAIPHHRRAAAKALRRSANEEAIGHLRRALDEIGAIPDADERAACELALLIALGAAHMAIRGFGAAEVLEAYTRAETLCARLGERADIFPALWGQWLFRWGRSELDAAWLLCERLLAMAEKSADAGLRLQAHHAAWATSLGRGDLREVHVHAKAGLALYDPKTHPAMASSYGNHDACCCARNFRALAFALAGEAAPARVIANDAIAFARDLSDPFTLALALYFASATAQMAGDLALAVRYAETSRQLAEEHDLALPKAWSTGVLGWCIVESGEPDRGIAMLSDAIATLNDIQSRHFMSYQLGLLAQAQIEAGYLADATAVIKQGLRLADRGGERYYAAELHRLNGEVLARSTLAQKRTAHESFRTAIRIARQQGAAMLERRASESLRRWSA